MLLVSVEKTRTGTGNNMYGMVPMWAGQVNTRGSRGNDLDLEAYLRTEYLGGMTLAALRRDAWLRRSVSVRPGGRRIFRRPVRTSTRDRVRSVVVRIVATAMVFLRRGKPGREHPEG